MKAYEYVLAKLNEAGKEAYLVGGCVRDLLLGRTPDDYDVTTSASPEEMLSIFSDTRLIGTGLRHGTVTVLVDGTPVEVTTYRTDGRYTDHRHPDSVVFAPSLREDLARRDFTVNAMAMSGDGGIIDLFGGREDLEKRIIRCVGDPYKRFDEDALRILRALRFSSTLDFEIDAETARAAAALAPTLRFVSPERIFSELKKLLCGKRAGRVILESREALSTVAPPLAAIYGFDQNNPHHCYTLDEHTAAAVDACPPNVTLRLAALLHDVGKPLCESRDEQGVSHFHGHAQKSAELADALLRDLKSDNRTREDVVFLIRHHDAPAEEKREQMLKRLNRCGVGRYRMLIALRRADNMGQAPEYHRTELHDRSERWLQELLRERACFSLRDLAVNGGDLRALGLPPSPKIGSILDRLLREVMSGTLQNERGALLARAKEFL